jgi:thiol:disulfide interchange protein/DsbC/DsbD-like thiol-disulfide interchange protein
MTLRLFNRLLLAFLPISMALGQSAMPPATSLPAIKEDKKHHTQLQLVGSVKTVRPGMKFTVGVLMKMERGWHTYWKNSGEAGLPTQAKWTMPKGFTSGEIQWPIPHKYNESGEVLTYGYADENMLLVDIVPSADVAIGSAVTLRADVDWLECERICVPGRAFLELKLPVAGGEPLAANARLFEKYRNQIPASFTEHTGFTFSATAVNAILEVRLKAKEGQSFVAVKDALPDLYPEPIDELVFGRTQVDANASGATLRIPLSVYEKTARSFTFRGVVVYQMEGGKHTAVTIEVPLAGDFISSLSVAGEAASSGSVLDQTFSTVKTGNGDQPLYLFVLFAIMGGLLLNVMPCVLPVIALKIFGLVRMGGDQPKHVKRLAWSFSAGILVTFLLLALLVILLQAAGEQIGWGFQFQEPLFVIAMSVIVFAFGLSLFGVYEVGLPFVLAFVGVGSAMEKRTSEDKGYVTSFFEGVFATILATPCTAPFLGTAFGFAFSQPAWVTLLLFASAGVGMGLPYVVLAPRPSWMKFLPKPGAWMVDVKQFMGFLMMATLIWLLYVLGKQLGMEGVIWTSAFLLCVGLSCWIVGKFATLTVSRAKYVLTWVVAVAISVGGYWVFLESILDVRNVIAGVPSVAQESASNEARGIRWRPFSLDELNTLLQENKAVFIDFTADWCLTCKVNEGTVLTNEEVIQKFKSTGIIPIKADWTNRNPDVTRLLSKFGRSGVPLYVIFPPGKPNQPIVLPEVITIGMVIDALGKATGS